MLFINEAFAQQAADATAQGGALSGLIPLLLVFAVFYFLLIRPQHKKIKQHQNMVKAITRGDEIVTAGGIIGTVTKAKEGDNIIEVEISNNVNVKVSRNTISEVLKNSKNKKPANDDAKPNSINNNKQNKKGKKQQVGKS